MPNMYDIVKVCEQRRVEKPFIKVTSGNDPTISTAMRYSTYIENTTPKTQYVSSAGARLASQGITFVPILSPILVSLQFTNLKQFNMPRLKVFSRVIKLNGI
jgi:hypothetical protein